MRGVALSDKGGTLARIFRTRGVGECENYRRSEQSAAILGFGAGPTCLTCPAKVLTASDARSPALDKDPVG